jgi:hypothetical protein
VENSRRWVLTILVMVTFCLVTLGILGSIHSNSTVDGEWKEILLLLLGAFIGSYGKIVDYWFGKDDDKTKE